MLYCKRGIRCMSAFQYGVKQRCEIYAHRSEEKVHTHTHTHIYIPTHTHIYLHTHTHTHTQVYGIVNLTLLKLSLSFCLIKHRTINAYDGV